MIARQIAAALTLLVLGSLPASTGALELDLDYKEPVRHCENAKDKPVKAPAGHQSYKWHRVDGFDSGVLLEEGRAVVLTKEMLMPLPSDCLSPDKPHVIDLKTCAAADGVKHLFVHVTTQNGNLFGLYEIENVTLQPVIKLSPENGVEREEKLTLSVEDAGGREYESYEWRFLGFVDRSRFGLIRDAKTKNVVTPRVLTSPSAGPIAVLQQPPKASRHWSGSKANEKSPAEASDPYQAYKQRLGTIVKIRNDLLPTTVGVRVDYAKEGKTITDMTVLPEKLGTAATAEHHPVFDESLYTVTVTDTNGCEETAYATVEVDQHRLDFLLAVDFSRINDEDEQDMMEAQEDGDLFENEQTAIGIRAEQYVRPFLQVYGGARFGGANVQSESRPEEALRQADAFIADLGVMQDLGCGPATQACFFTKGEASALFIAEDIDGDGEDDTFDDLRYRAFAGAGWRYHKPGKRFHRTFTELGIGYSGNFEDPRPRFKLRTGTSLQLNDAWDIILTGEIDNGQGLDDLRVMIGARRDFSGVASGLATILGLGDDAE